MNKLSIVVIFLMLLLSSCVSTKQKTKEVKTNQELIKYFNSFNPQWREAIKSKKN